MNEKFSKLIDDLCYTSSLAEIKIENNLQKDLSHNTSLYRKIICKESGKHTISSISKLLSVKTTAVTQKVNELEVKNYVVRKQSEKDKRISYLHAVEKFCPCQDAFKTRNDFVIKKLQVEYTKEEIELFLKILESTTTHFLDFDTKGDE